MAAGWQHVVPHAQEALHVGYQATPARVRTLCVEEISEPPGPAVAWPRAERIRSVGRAQLRGSFVYAPGIAAAQICCMPPNPDRNPNSYEEIGRRTVASREDFRALDADERALYDQVVDAIAAAGAAGVTAEVRRDLVTLRGWVADAALLRAVDDAIARIPGVETIHDQIVVGAT